jgi:hypothetical protein
MSWDPPSRIAPMLTRCERCRHSRLDHPGGGPCLVPSGSCGCAEFEGPPPPDDDDDDDADGTDSEASGWWTARREAGEGAT